MWAGPHVLLTPCLQGSGSARLLKGQSLTQLLQKSNAAEPACPFIHSFIGFIVDYGAFIQRHRIDGARSADAKSCTDCQASS